MTEQSQPPSTPSEFAALIGVDWADQKHDICLLPAGAQQLERSVLNHRPETLADWIGQLRQRFGGGRIAIAVEQSRGALVHALMSHEFIVIYPINPIMLKRLREAFANSGAKDDPTDAELALEVLRKHRDRLTPWQPEDVATRTLARLNEHRRDAVNQRTRLVQQLTATLKEYFPQALELVGEDLATPLACDFLTRWPALSAVQKARPATLRQFYYRHQCRRRELVEQRIQRIVQTVPLTTDAAIVETAVLRVQLLIGQLRSLNRILATYDQRIREVFAQHPERSLYQDLPGAGPALAPRLLTAFGTDRQRYPQPSSLQQFSGVAPVTERSGKHCWVHRRYACPKFLLQSFHEYAGQSIHKCGWAAAYYQHRRVKGQGHHAAIRALAFKWIRILWRCWQSATPYDEQRYLESLRRRGSWLATELTKMEVQACA